ncbi:MAG: DNA-formamidopyrimidine glycosylase family protein [Candidatus Bathyarchaeia archaeon]
MSVELPEAYILAGQMNRELRGRKVAEFSLQNHEKLQRLGFVNRDATAFKGLVGGRVESVVTRGNVMRVKLDNGLNLILAPEYGGTILFHGGNSGIPEKFHLRLHFTDGSQLTVTLTGMGIIQALKDEELEQSYVYRRDFSATSSPMNEAEFTFERFSDEIASRNVNIKPALVGKDAAIVGLSNSAFQDILFRAGIHPKRKASSLTEKERRALYNAIGQVIQARIKAGGKSQFVDLYGRQGNYTPFMGPNMKDKACTVCGAKVEKLGLGGGQVFFCPKCQI